MFFKKLPFWVEKMNFTQKQKLFQKTLIYCKTGKKDKIFKIYYFWGDLWSPKMGKKAQNDLIHEPLTPLKKFFGEN